jgi:chloramphenicol 3-O-phosphotransferase
VKCQKGEDFKFILKCGHKTSEWRTIQLNLKIGTPKSMNREPRILKLPAPVENFVGRQNECKSIIEMLDQSRYVSVEGTPGIGKSAIVKNVANLLAERAVFDDGILYVTLKDLDNLEELLKKIFLSLQVFINLSKDNEKKKIEQLESTEIYWEILRSLNNLELLLILDNWRILIEKDGIAFFDFIHDFLEKLSRIKIIITWVRSPPVMNDVKERVFKVKRLSDKQALELLKVNAEWVATHNKEISELLKASPNYESELKMHMFKHDLFKILNGHPLSIIIFASLRKNMNLLQLFQLLKKIKDNISSEVIDQSTLSLTLNVEASLIFVKEENEQAYEALLFFSLSPSGYLTQHIAGMFGYNWEGIQNILLSRSLLQKKKTWTK